MVSHDDERFGSLHFVPEDVTPEVAQAVQILREAVLQVHYSAKKDMLVARMPFIVDSEFGLLPTHISIEKTSQQPVQWTGRILDLPSSTPQDPKYLEIVETSLGLVAQKMVILYRHWLDQGVLYSDFNEDDD